MMREKVNMYRQYAANLLGNADSAFTTPFGSADDDDQVDQALFLSFKRLFTRDKVKRETFAIKMYQSASDAQSAQNLKKTSTVGVKIFTDFGSSTNRRRTFGGEVGDLVDSSDSSKKVGLIFYDAGTAVLNLGGRGAYNALTQTGPAVRAIDAYQEVSGAISAMVAGTQYQTNVPLGQQLIAAPFRIDSGGNAVGIGSRKFVPDLMVSASIDDIVDHFSMCRFSSGSLTAATFQNNTNINSTLIFCRATADEFNYSSNPTYTDTANRVRVIEQGQEDVQRSFTFITTVGLYDVNDNLLAVAKLSRPIEKNDEKDLTVRVRLDF